jgi:hypothetical protein
MQNVVEESRERWSRTDAEPLSALRVSWGAVLAGTVTILGVSVILWALALAIISLVARPNPVSLGNSAFALWICGMAATLIAAFIGGWLAGYLPGNGRRAIGVAHGFLAWCVAMLVSFGLHMIALRSAFGTAANVIAESARAPEVEVEAASRALLGYMQWFGWTWFGTWFVAGLLAMAGAAMGVRRLSGPRARVHRAERIVREPPFGSPVTPAT